MNPLVRNLLIIGGGLVVLGFLARRQLSAVGEAIANPNEGTPFEDTGIVGTLGNITDQASGGIFGRIGSAIGVFFSGPLFDKRTIDEVIGPPPPDEFVGPPSSG